MIQRLPRLARPSAALLLLGLLTALLALGAGPPQQTALAQAVPRSDMATLSEPGPYAVEARDVTVPRPDGRDAFDARLFIPLANEADAPETTAPMVAFGHGYLAPVAVYGSTLRHLASWGLAVIAPHSGGELFPDHADVARDLIIALDWLAQAPDHDADWAGLPLDSEARAVSGHSMGGGAAVLASAMDPRIGAVATLAAADTRPSAISAAAGIDVPALFMAGSDDRITPLADHQRPMYEAKTSAATQLRIIDGGGHCGYLDGGNLIGLVCGRAGMDAAEQRSLSQSLLTAWLRHELAADASMLDVAWPRSPTDGTTAEIKGVGPTP